MPPVIPHLPVGHRSGQLEITALLPDHIDPAGRQRQRATVQCGVGHSYDINVNVYLWKGTARCHECFGHPSKYKVGDRYDKLVIQSFFYDAKRRRMAQCLCECGKPTTVLAKMLSQNKTHNCGCAPSGNYKGCGEVSGAFFYNIRHSADARGIPFDVTKEQIWNLFLKQDKRCALTGLPITLWVRDRTKGTASLDRRDSDGPYTLSNVQWVHKDINRMKNAFTEERFLILCRRVTEYQDGTAKSVSREVVAEVRPRLKPPGRKDHRSRRASGPPLTVAGILADADKFYTLHGRWPTTVEKTPVPDKPHECWNTYSSALRVGTRGLPGGSSLYKLLRESRCPGPMTRAPRDST